MLKGKNLLTLYLRACGIKRVNSIGSCGLIQHGMIQNKESTVLFHDQQLVCFEASGGMFCRVSWRAYLSLSGSDFEIYMHTLCVQY